MDAEFSSFENCSEFTQGQLTVVVLTRGITAAICCAALLIVLVVLGIAAVPAKRKICGTVAKRLTIWLTAATVPYQLVLVLHLESYILSRNVKSCKAYGFLVQYFGSVQLLLTLGISMVLFFKVWDATPWKPERVEGCHKRTKECTFACCGCKINKLEVVFLVLVFGLPLLLDWIPFTTDSYGATGPWCWIRSIEKNCTIHTAGLVEQIVLWNVPFAVVALLTLVLFITSSCLLGCAIKNSEAQHLLEKGITDSVFSLAFLAVMFALCVVEVTTRTYSFDKPNFGVWVVYAISTPLGRAFIPIAVLMAIYFPLSFMISRVCHKSHKSWRKRRSADGIHTTINNNSNWSVLNQPSHTTFDPPHSSVEVSDQQ